MLFGIGTVQRERIRDAERRKPYYVEMCLLEGEVVVRGFQIMSDAVNYAISRTKDMYRLNGILNGKEAKIFDSSGKHIETIRSGLREEEYNAIKEKTD